MIDRDLVLLLAFLALCGVVSMNGNGNGKEGIDACVAGFDIANEEEEDDE